MLLSVLLVARNVYYRTVYIQLQRDFLLGFLRRVQCGWGLNIVTNAPPRDQSSFWSQVPHDS